MVRLLPALGISAMTAATGLGAGVAWADENPVVVELYTSQGCAVCPPADEMFQQFAAMDGVIALALHVDYWDYIGWKDIFADPAFTVRQQDYARAAGERMVYTPQLIVGGTETIVGADAVAVMEQIAAHAADKSGVILDLRRDGAALAISAEADLPQNGPLDVQVVRYIPEQTVTIESGENAGQTLRYVNIVTEWQTVARWQAVDPFSISVPVMGSEPVVVILQEPGPGRIVAAAVLD